MPVVPLKRPAPHRLLAGLVSIVMLGVVMDHALALPLVDEPGGSPSPLVGSAGHLLVSEVMTGGASASDEFIELYNPTSAELPLEGLEVVYVTATGATITRKAAWSAGAAGVLPGAHLLVGNGAGIFAGVADVVYANGLAATGGSVALRVIGAATAIDAVGWGNATSTWLETGPAPAPPAGSSLERLPGGTGGSGQDTDDNVIDFVVQPVPDPQNSGSPPIAVGSDSPSPTESPTDSPIASITPPPGDTPTPEPSVVASPSESSTPLGTPSFDPTPTPSPTVISIAEARAQPDGALVTVEGVTLTKGDFTDGGGYLADASAGIAVLVADGSFARGTLLRVTGTIDDRYAQRTIRTAAADLQGIGPGGDPLPLDATTGSIGEAYEGLLVEVVGVISSSATTLSAGIAWDLDDGSGAVRVLVVNGSGIDTSRWERGVGLTLIGVVGQRDSSGSGASGYRIQPRDTADVLALVPTATPSPTPTPTLTASGSSSASPSETPPSPLVSIADARAATTGTRLRIRGVVTAPSGLIEAGSAVVQDTTAAILVRIGADVGTLALGQLVELEGTRSTKAGMLSLRVSDAPVYLGTPGEPDALRRATGALGEAEEARLVIARGEISGAISRPRGGNVSFAIDDGSGPIRVTISSRSSISAASLVTGTWVELRAVLAQETTGSAPTSGYRLWPRIPTDVQLIAAPVAGSRGTTGCCSTAQDLSTSDILVHGQPDEAATSGSAGVAPILARPQPTPSPRQSSITSHGAHSSGPGTAAGGLVVSGMGLAALAGMAAWTGRRGRPDGDPSALEGEVEQGELDASEVVPAIPRLSVLRGEVADAQKERRILPPT